MSVRPDDRDSAPHRPIGACMDLVAILLVVALGAAAFGWLRLVDRA
jgi:hypothetical protein